MIHYPNENIIVRFGDMELSANAEKLMLTYLRSLSVAVAPATKYAPTPLKPPRFGEVWQGQGGIYSGIVAHRAGGPGYYLITGPELSDKGAEWEEMKANAAELEIEGHTDFTLPYRDEQELQFANIPGLFEKAWYWSREQGAGDADSAWIQDFSDGGQGHVLKSSQYRARAVRRVLIIQ